MATISGILINPRYPNDGREVKFTSVYGGWRDDSKGSITNGKIYSETVMDQILAQYPDLKVG
jgi:hypothetical protein